ncbi:MAG: PHP domain-containing protein [Erysipelotrichaceae bacterium]|nr:PHP domain-containing protein [Erysipelotrichaceae bacterium]MDY5251656.1 PHP domain-containing protein [Erysipelotrichaceae bacterium]
MEEKFDFHMHSAYSPDGELSIEALIAMAKAKGLKYIALSDHNDNKGLDEMITIGKQNGITVIPAIEFDTCLGDFDVHLLGYGLEYHHPYFYNLAANINQMMDDALAERVAKFKEKYDIDIDLAKCIQQAKGQNPFFNIVDDLLSDPKAKDIEELHPYQPGGARSDMPAINFFWDKCSYGTDLFVKVKFPDFKETVDLIHRHGGIAILAHPFKTFYQQEALLQQAITSGIDGIECFSNYHDAAQNKYYYDFCKKHGLLISGGSDFHGKNKPHIQMGEYGLNVPSDEILRPFLRALNVKGQ